MIEHVLRGFGYGIGRALAGSATNLILIIVAILLVYFTIKRRR